MCDVLWLLCAVCCSLITVCCAMWVAACLFFVVVGESCVLLDVCVPLFVDVYWSLFVVGCWLSVAVCLLCVCCLVCVVCYDTFGVCWLLCVVCLCLLFVVLSIRD